MINNTIKGNSWIPSGRNFTQNDSRILQEAKDLIDSSDDFILEKSPTKEFYLSFINNNEFVENLTLLLSKHSCRPDRTESLLIEKIYREEEGTSKEIMKRSFIRLKKASEALNKKEDQTFLFEFSFFLYSFETAVRENLLLRHGPHFFLASEESHSQDQREKNGDQNLFFMDNKENSHCLKAKTVPLY